jgi:hypothetical protein
MHLLPTFLLKAGIARRWFSILLDVLTTLASVRNMMSSCADIKNEATVSTELWSDPTFKNATRILRGGNDGQVMPLSERLDEITCRVDGR